MYDWLEGGLLWLRSGARNLDRLIWLWQWGRCSAAQEYPTKKYHSGTCSEAIESKQAASYPVAKDKQPESH
jgi:hypothetical protein